MCKVSVCGVVGVTVCNRSPRVSCKKRVLEIPSRGCHTRILWPRVLGKLVLCMCLKYVVVVYFVHHVKNINIIYPI